jgi:hypothetical protein
LEAGKKRLLGDTRRDAKALEVWGLRDERCGSSRRRLRRCWRIGF